MKGDKAAAMAAQPVHRDFLPSPKIDKHRKPTQMIILKNYIKLN